MEQWNGNGMERLQLTHVILVELPGVPLGLLSHRRGFMSEFNVNCSHTKRGSYYKPDSHIISGFVRL